MATLDEGEVRALLEEERDRLQQIRMALSGESPNGRSEDRAVDELPLLDRHPADGGTQTLERERDRSILEHVDAQLAEVDRAIERLELGRYGTCEACGRPIDGDRLRARPAARFCIEDQSRAERSVP